MQVQQETSENEEEIFAAEEAGTVQDEAVDTEESEEISFDEEVQDEIQIEDPSVIRQGSKFGVKIKSKSPSVHMIKAEIETEIAPIVGTEQQAKDLIQYIGESGQRGESIWETNIFGKSIEQLVQDGIRSKIASIGEESQSKLQDTMQKIVNDSKGGMVCIII